MKPGTCALMSVAMALGGFRVWRKKIKRGGPQSK
jgi:hypothetical protein